MKFQRRGKISVIGSVLIGLITTFAPSGASQSEQKEANKIDEPSIQITLIPPKGEGPDSNGTIGGKASGPSLKECKVVIFARTDKWYVQPTVASPDTPIGEGGKWETDIHLGYEYAALLVKSSYEPQSTYATGALPKVGGAVLAIARVPAKKE